MSIGAILQITAYGVPQMIVGRIVAGIGNGINTATAPPWQAETSKASWRGKLIVIELILNIAGFSLSNWVTFGFSYVPGPVAWRLPLAMQFIFIFVLYATVPWLPESPRWLVMVDRNKEAEQILADLEGTEVEDPYIQTQMSEIKFAANYEREHAVRIRDLLRGKKGGQAGTCTLRRLLLGMGAQFMQQFSGMLQHRRSGNAVADSIRHQCHQLLPPHSPHHIRRLRQPHGPPPRRSQQRQLPPLLHHRHPKRGALGSKKDADVRGRWAGVLLPDYHHLHQVCQRPFLRACRAVW